MRITDRLAGVAIAACFIPLGLDAVRNPGKRVDMAAEFGVPFPEQAVRVNGAVMVAGGLGLLTGIQRRAAAAGLLLSMIPTTAAGHAFWRETDPAALKASRVQFLKNVGLAGGLIGEITRTDAD